MSVTIKSKGKSRRAIFIDGDAVGEIFKYTGTKGFGLSINGLYFNIQGKVRIGGGGSPSKKFKRRVDAERWAMDFLKDVCSAI